ncbi:MAG: sterol desaturase family protein [Pseudomonadota bacterium]
MSLETLSLALTDLLARSGLADLWSTVAPLLALDARQAIFVVASPVFIGLALWEYRKIRHDPRLTEAKESIRNFFLGAGYQTTELLFAGIIAFPVFALAYHFRIATIELTWLSGLALFVAFEFLFYWMHRFSHRVRWFWCAHVVHHSSERMNLSTAMRQNATNIFNGGWLLFVPLAFIGFNPVWIGIVFALDLVYQFFIHTTLVGKLHPAIEFVFNTPSHHRAHHGRNERYIDKNYGGVLIIFDRLFGTFEEEREDEPVEYGILRQVHTESLVKSWTHEYVDMARDMRKPGPLLQRLKHLWMPPEWERGARGEPQRGAREDRQRGDDAAGEPGTVPVPARQ